MKRLHQYRPGFSALGARLRGFARNERGNASMELIVVFPLFMLIIGLSVDLSMSFVNLNKMHDVARDTARRAAVGGLTNAEAQAFAITQLDDALGATVLVADGDPGDVLVTIEAPAENLSPLGYVSWVGVGASEVTMTMRREG